MYTCKCCNHPTLPVPPENAIAFICPDCFWVNDVFTADENEPSDENRGLTLTEGRENYNRYGICDPRLKESNGRGSDESTVPQEPISEMILGGSSKQKSFVNPKTTESK